ncbi:methyltransferase family protein [Methanofollis fontis]|uniref:Isoprenylcysteine carboxylmethyltransferase family protein n=1 Tax=Methanofollis fontis TaxID=2052832 RepID=A0A483CZB4_9EURY|nr:isoprenylcysteine carboxylmethyltransferase family protein [Methanofollis fontis]TAJ45399.1 hypothetical protein CUJ86_01260 [Methanofollis fontis]
MGASLVLFLLFPSYNLLTLPWNRIGLLPIAAGFWIIIRAWRVFVACGTTESYREETTCLVTDDLYRYSRNPMYVGFVVAHIGLCVCCFANLLSFAGPLFVFLVLNFHFIPYEEGRMIKQFGDDYRRYMGRVRRWV